MKFKKPNSESVKAFLIFKNWDLVETGKGHFLMKAPAHLGFEPDFLLHVPRWRDSPHYGEIATDILTDVARLYEWEPEVLIHLLCKAPDELEIFIREAILEAVKKEQVNASAEEKIALDKKAKALISSFVKANGLPKKSPVLERRPANLLERKNVPFPKNEPAMAA